MLCENISLTIISLFSINFALLLIITLLIIIIECFLIDIDLLFVIIPIITLSVLVWFYLSWLIITISIFFRILPCFKIIIFLKGNKVFKWSENNRILYVIKNGFGFTFIISIITENTKVLISLSNYLTQKITITGHT